MQSSSGGFSGGTIAVGGSLTIDLGTIVMPAGSVGTYLINGLQAGVNYTVSLIVSGITGLGHVDAPNSSIRSATATTRSILRVQPAYVPAGYSTSNNKDGLSFAQDSALARSAIFAGGSAMVTADELTNQRDILTFAGLGSGMARVTFGLRNYGSNGFLSAAECQRETRRPNRRRCCCSAPVSPDWRRIAAAVRRPARLRGGFCDAASHA